MSSLFTFLKCSPILAVTVVKIIRPRTVSMFMYQTVIEKTKNYQLFKMKNKDFFCFLGLNPPEPDRTILNDYIVKECREGRTIFKCTLCSNANSKKQTMVNHVESVHFPGTFLYTCKYCGKEYNAKNSLNVHVSTSHREDKKLPTF